MPSSTGRASGRSSAEVIREIEQFLQTARDPILCEPGEPAIPLAPGRFDLSEQSGRVMLTAWSDEAQVTRRIADITRSAPGQLSATVERFGKRRGELLFVDRARPRAQHAVRRIDHVVFREQFRTFLTRAFPDWQLAELTTEADLVRSLSPNFSRALLCQGRAGWAAIGASDDHAAHVLSFGLIWLDYLRRREPKLTIQGLVLLVPAGCEQATQSRIVYLDHAAARFHLYVLAPDGRALPVDVHDHGNLDTHLPDRLHDADQSNGQVDAWVDQIAELAEVERIELRPGHSSLRVNGLEFARRTGRELTFGLETKHLASASNLPEILALARELARRRARGERRHPLAQRSPELWLEAQVRRHWEQIDATLLPTPLYGQAPSFAGQDRCIIDLLAIGCDGRLAVVELKASEELHLPLQALDYWLRVKWHLDRSEFAARGYFPAERISTAPPRILLVAPALQFHPTTETILRYFSPDIPVERIGVNQDWQTHIRVMFRLQGAGRPYRGGDGNGDASASAGT